MSKETKKQFRYIKVVLLILAVYILFHTNQIIGLKRDVANLEGIVSVTLDCDTFNTKVDPHIIL